jgi:hypothetical protein
MGMKMKNGTVLATADGGDHWNSQTSVIEASLISRYFADRMFG